jgi:hypothetical protein
VSSRRHHFVTNEVKPDYLGHRAGKAIAEMTVHGIFHHRAQLVERIALGNNAVPSTSSSCTSKMISLTEAI